MNSFELWDKVARNSQYRLPQPYRLAVVAPWGHPCFANRYCHCVCPSVSRINHKSSVWSGGLDSLSALSLLSLFKQFKSTASCRVCLNESSVVGRRWCTRRGEDKHQFVDCWYKLAQTSTEQTPIAGRCRHSVVCTMFITANDSVVNLLYTSLT